VICCLGIFVILFLVELMTSKSGVETWLYWCLDVNGKEEGDREGKKGVQRSRDMR
jgi:hypothetical protein